LKSLPAIGTPISRASANAAGKSRLRFVSLERFLEFRDALVRLAGLDVALGAAAPDGDEAIDALIALERPNVVAKPFDHFRLAGGFFRVRAVQALHVLGVEGGGHRPNGLELGRDWSEVLFLEHARRASRFEHVVLEHVPAAENEVVKTSERNEVADQRHAIVGSLAEANRTELRERAGGRGEALLREKTTRKKSTRDRTHSGQEHAELSAVCGDLVRSVHACHTSGAPSDPCKAPHVP
jgi:hypothetical protein